MNEFSSNNKEGEIYDLQNKIFLSTWVLHSFWKNNFSASISPCFLFLIFLFQVLRKRDVVLKFRIWIDWPFFSGKKSVCRCRRSRFNPWVRKIPWMRKRQPTPASLPGKSHGQRSLAAYSLLRYKELDMS